VTTTVAQIASWFDTKKSADMSTGHSHRGGAGEVIRSRIIHYCIAVVAAGLAAGANGALWPDFGVRYPLIAFYPAITISAWFGGLLPGLSCTILSAMIAAFVWLDPQFSVGVTPSADALALIVFTGVGVVISALSESLKSEAGRERAARARAQHAEATLAIELADTRRLYKLSEMLMRRDGLADILQEVLHAAIELLHADSGDVQINDAAEEHLNMIAEFGVPEGFLEATHGNSISAEVLRRHRTVVVDDVARDQTLAQFAPLYASHAIVSVVCVPMLESDGKVLGLLSTYFSKPRQPTDRELLLLDLYTRQGGHAIERMRILESERLARREAEHANRQKDHFLSTVSHDLRTPLHAVLGWTELLRGGRLPDAKRARALQMIYDNTQRQTRLISDLLDTSRIMSGTLRLERTTVDLQTVVQGALEVVELSATEKGVDLVVDRDPEIGTLSGDPARLQQVIWNLLANAVKFTPKGGAVDVRIRRIGQSVEIVVEDTGIGIAREFLPFVFEPFRQADTVSARSNGGLGLGLSIVKHLVEGHGGTIQADSNGEGQGAVFTVRLPIDPDRSEEVRSPAPSQSAQPELPLLEGVAVLVVDDDWASRELVAASLEDVGARVMTTASSAEALDQLSRHKFDVLIVDIAMPGEDGCALIRRVRATPAPDIARIPAVAFTSFDGDDAREAMAAGFQEHLRKPSDAASLARTVALLVHRVWT
jgi:signal transduction histidine kinase/CheY-like chemotaxis protein